MPLRHAVASYCSPATCHAATNGTPATHRPLLSLLHLCDCSEQYVSLLSRPTTLTHHISSALHKRPARINMSVRKPRYRFYYRDDATKERCDACLRAMLHFAQQPSASSINADLAQRALRFRQHSIEHLEIDDSTQDAFERLGVVWHKLHPTSQ
ncbi:hypothetical protein SPRG_19366 [Saprolegnia parasitica CBS 223.65]|uniref:Uncharacterized protein n=1 Tax=Saprolegnia parasitica (strain CBS 223.65) TaxID=695850 RepID=A0A067CR56_SAPPC|nr:hypothetical protein SPRG_19366 [Saprolegnia parasitica CBS 223.65]KDO33008.1 hypothetical protein SPRG_19366 [Saprolegnia parasitica CBS 223.65]|eukprot:XP_012196254.1 hypothetical protein SPRG_19366 [Saprolegnia parasitica CBS 223.65]